jgi:hypothetical protein
MNTCPAGEPAANQSENAIANGRVCPCCGAKVVTYSHCFSRALATFLLALYRAGGPAKTDDLGLTYAQRTNSQKLRYWGLARPVLNADSKAKRGLWEITDKGREFVEGKATIPRRAHVQRNMVIRIDGDPLAFAEVSDGYQFRAEFAAQAREQLR